MFYTIYCVDVKTKKIFKDICHSNSTMFKTLTTDLNYIDNYRHLRLNDKKNYKKKIANCFVLVSLTK